MRNKNKLVKLWLENWGEYKRHRLSISLANKSISCDPDSYIGEYYAEPSFRFPKSSGISTVEYLNRCEKKEASLRKQTNCGNDKETRASRTPNAPNYKPDWAVNKIDRAIRDLDEIYYDIAKMRYENEFKRMEIGLLLDAPVVTVDKRISKMHELMWPIISDVSHETYSLLQKL